LRDNGGVWRFAVIVVVAGCGRLGFDAIDRDAPGDGRAFGDGALADTIPSAQLCTQTGVFCDGFESGDLSRWTGTSACSACTVGASEMYAHTGSYGLLGDTTGAASVSDTAEAYVTFASRSTGTLAVRIWAEAIGVADQDAGVLELGAGASDFSHALVIAATDAQVWALSEIYGMSDQEVDHATTETASQHVWTCFEIDYAFGAPSEIAFYIDDAQALSVTASDTAPAFGALYVGAERATDSGAVMAIDDVVVASQHIGCD
jgi:hypothetical protein